MGYFCGHGGWGTGLTWLFMIIVWILVIVGIIAVIRWLTNRAKTDSKSPLEILKDRFAEGEITEAEFKEKKKILRE